jgi:hypothetical protein
MWITVGNSPDLALSTVTSIVLGFLACIRKLLIYSIKMYQDTEAFPLGFLELLTSIRNTSGFLSFSANIASFQEK